MASGSSLAEWGEIVYLSLNPSFTGIWLRGRPGLFSVASRRVLTLLLLEFGFGELIIHPLKNKETLVLTLLLLEFGFGGLRKNHKRTAAQHGLNPSFTGIWLRGPSYVDFTVDPSKES